jgi:hypothetical protein
LVGRTLEEIAFLESLFNPGVYAGRRGPPEPSELEPGRAEARGAITEEEIEIILRLVEELWSVVTGL